MYLLQHTLRHTHTHARTLTKTSLHVEKYAYRFRAFSCDEVGEATQSEKVKSSKVNFARSWRRPQHFHAELREVYFKVMACTQASTHRHTLCIKLCYIGTKTNSKTATWGASAMRFCMCVWHTLWHDGQWRCWWNMPRRRQQCQGCIQLAWPETKRSTMRELLCDPVLIMSNSSLFLKLKKIKNIEINKYLSKLRSKSLRCCRLRR